jgi:hypothetical protein
MIEAKGLIKRYGDKLAVDDLSFTVRPGVVTGLPRRVGEARNGIVTSLPPGRGRWAGRNRPPQRSGSLPAEYAQISHSGGSLGIHPEGERLQGVSSNAAWPVVLATIWPLSLIAVA